MLKKKVMLCIVESAPSTPPAKRLPVDYQKKLYIQLFL
jgi:hypothetical protein